MRIGLVCGSFLPEVGGTEWKVHHLASQYLVLGHDVTVFTLRLPESQARRPMPVEPGYDVVRCSRPLPLAGRLGLHERRLAAAVLERHRRRPFEVLHTHHLGLPTAAGAQVRAATQRALRVVATTCGGDCQVLPKEGYGDRLQPRKDRLFRSNLGRVDAVVAVNTAIRDDLVSLGATARVVSLPNGVDWAAFQGPRERVLHERLALPEGAVIVLSVGSNRPVKNLEVAVRSFAYAAADHAKAHHVLVGRDLEPLGELARDLGLADRVHLVCETRMGELPSFFRSADLFFGTSLIEGFAQVNLQAMAAGLPLVLSDVPGNRDAAVVAGAPTADARDPGALGRCLAGLLARPEERARLGRRAREASRRFDWTRLAEEYLALFAELADA